LKSWNDLLLKKIIRKAPVDEIAMIINKSNALTLPKMTIRIVSDPVSAIKTLKI
jgi:hypothetical protein